MPCKMDWFVYILQCADQSFYTGITKDLERRLDEHNTNNQKGARYTRARRPVKLIYHEKQNDRASASQREYQIKRLTRQQKIRLISTKTITSS